MAAEEARGVEVKELRSVEEFEKATNKGVTLVDFNAPWCAPCRTQEPIIRQLASQFEGRASVAAMNLDENQSLAIRLGIQSIPTLVLFKEGKEARRFVGLQPQDALSEALESILD